MINIHLLWKVQRDPVTGFQLATKQPLKAGEDCWLIDHSVTTHWSIIEQQILATDGLIDRLWSMFDVERREKIKIIELQNSQLRIPPPKPIDGDFKADPGSVELLMENCEISHDEAVAALAEANGDVITALQEVEARQSRPKTLEIDEESLDAVKLPSYTDEQRAKLIVATMFEAQLCGVYHVTAPNQDRSELSGDSIESVLFINDEVGTSIRTGSSFNCRVAPLVAIHLGGASFSLLWLLDDVQEDEELVAQPRPPVPSVNVFNTANFELAPIQMPSTQVSEDSAPVA